MALPMEGDAVLAGAGDPWGQTPPGLSLAAHGFPLHLPFLKGFYILFVVELASISNKN